MQNFPKVHAETWYPRYGLSFIHGTFGMGVREQVYLMSFNTPRVIVFLINLKRGLRMGPHLIRRVDDGTEPACLSMHIIIANQKLLEPFSLEEMRLISAILMQYIIDQVHLHNLDRPLCEDIGDLIENIPNILACW